MERKSICGAGDDLPIRLSIVRRILKAQVFHFQTCSRKSLSAPQLQSIYVVSIPGAVPPEENIRTKPRVLGRSLPSVGLAATYNDWQS